MTWFFTLRPWLTFLWTNFVLVLEETAVQYCIIWREQFSTYKIMLTKKMIILKVGFLKIFTLFYHHNLNLIYEFEYSFHIIDVKRWLYGSINKLLDLFFYGKTQWKLVHHYTSFTKKILYRYFKIVYFI